MAGSNTREANRDSARRPQWEVSASGRWTDEGNVLPEYEIEYSPTAGDDGGKGEEMQDHKELVLLLQVGDEGGPDEPVGVGVGEEGPIGGRGD